MEVLSQAPQPTIICYHSIVNGAAANIPYQEFTPNSADTSGQNLQSYNFERSIDNFGGSFSFTVKEDTEKITSTFMDKVQPLDVVVISESGSNNKIDFIGVITTISVGGIASNLNKIVTISGKSIEWLYSYFNINCDIQIEVFNNESANKTFLTDLAKRDGEEGISIKDIVIASVDAFRKQVSGLKNTDSINSVITNFLIGDLIDIWFGNDFVKTSDDKFAYPISSNLFTSGKINVIDYLKNLIPSPLYEIFGYIDDSNKPKLAVRKVPFEKPEAKYVIDPNHLTDYTLTRSCEEVYTAFLTYIEGTELSPDFYMHLAAAEGTVKGYNFAQPNKEKAAKYGYQLLTCSFVGYNSSPEAKTDKSIIEELNKELEEWFSNLDEMYTGDFTLVNITNEKHAKIGEWLGFAGGLYYVISEKHSWNYGDNPMINYQVIRGGEYPDGKFKPVKKLSAVYKEFEQ